MEARATFTLADVGGPIQGNQTVVAYEREQSVTQLPSFSDIEINRRRTLQVVPNHSQYIKVSRPT